LLGHARAAHASIPVNITIFVAFVLFFVLTIWGRRLREQAFRALPPEQSVNVVEKRPSYSSTEMIPFAALMLGLLSLTLFWPEWLRTGVALCLPLIVLLVGIFHVRARRRFRELSVPGGVFGAVREVSDRHL
jgi:hypothetical protein